MYLLSIYIQAITYCIYIDWELLFSGISAVASLVGFLLAIVIARQISFKKQLREKQLEVVFLLVQELQNLEIHFAFRVDQGANNLTVGTHWTYFLAMSTFKEQNRPRWVDAEKVILYVSEDFLYKSKLFEFVSNPFLPKNIAEALIKIYHRGGDQKEYNLMANEIYISADPEFDSHTYRKEISSYYQDLNAFIEASIEVKSEINKWLKKQNASDLNLREKPINLQNYP